MDATTFDLRGIAAGFLTNGALTIAFLHLSVVYHAAAQNEALDKIWLNSQWQKGKSSEEISRFVRQLLFRSFTKSTSLATGANLFFTALICAFLAVAFLALVLQYFRPEAYDQLSRAAYAGSLLFLALILVYLAVNFVLAHTTSFLLPSLIFDRRVTRLHRAKLLAHVLRLQIPGADRQLQKASGRKSPLAELYEDLRKTCFIYDRRNERYLPPLVEAEELDKAGVKIERYVAQKRAEAEALVAENKYLVFAPVLRGFIGLSKERYFAERDNEVIYYNFWNVEKGEAEVIDVERLAIAAEVPGLNYNHAIAAVLAELDARGLRPPLEVRCELPVSENARRQLAAYREQAGPPFA